MQTLWIQFRVVAVVAVSIVLCERIATAGNCDPEGHIDVAPVVIDGKIFTGIADYDVDPNGPIVTPGITVFGGEYGTIPVDPFFTDDPGFTALTGSGFPAGSFVGWDAIDDLLYWDGLGDVNFGPVPNNEQIRVKLGAQNRFVGTGTGFLAGYFFAAAGGGGDYHVHMSFFLLGADGNAVPASSDGIEATPGIYLLTYQLRSNAGITSSDPLYIVFNNILDPCLHCVALNTVSADFSGDQPKSDMDFDRDVDADDFAEWELCATGPLSPWSDPCCQTADIDDDSDSDLSDFAKLQQCTQGDGVVVPASCGL